ncbi:hypothetical protein MRB53_042341 [Persea americana]|nr:hypothetical protein MRB53_042341 [Persea americana]
MSMAGSQDSTKVLRNNYPLLTLDQLDVILVDNGHITHEALVRIYNVDYHTVHYVWRKFIWKLLRTICTRTEDEQPYSKLRAAKTPIFSWQMLSDSSKRSFQPSDRNHTMHYILVFYQIMSTLDFQMVLRRDE